MEKDIEQKLKVSLERMGCLVMKFVSPGNSGVPDRLVFIPGGRLLLVELKRPGKKLRPLQKVWKRKFEALGFMHFVVDCDEDILALTRVVQKIRGDNA
ncbi:VRR-NUC domain-containing protein [Anaerovibrio lipolyticus]|uniref:VRR-NUC domain-containing protein n=1 Tax=Anaerovibrio lipolyticus TaxID=82374 RepID=UPI001F197BA6|nr:VRR-NUC domain-containing protein [Anaerovibrio lipolyticus]